MIVNVRSIQQVFRSLNTLFQKELQLAPSVWKETAMLVPSNTKQEDYTWLSDFPMLREWFDEKTLKSFEAYEYSIKNRNFEATVKVRRDDLEDDNTGGLNLKARSAARSANIWPDQLVAEIKDKSFESYCYDGQYFYDTDHPVGKGVVSNKLTAPLSWANLAEAEASFGAAEEMIMGFTDDFGNPLGLMPTVLEVPSSLKTVAKMLLTSDKLADETPNPFKDSGVKLIVNPWLKNKKRWYMHYTGHPIMPYIFQQRKAPVFVEQTSEDNDNVFMRGEYNFGVEARGNTGFGLWRFSVGSDPA